MRRRKKPDMLLDETATGGNARKPPEAVLAESQATLNAMVNSTTDMIWSVDAERFGLLTFNDSLRDYFWHGRGIRIAVGMRPEDLFPTDDFIEQWREFYRKALQEGPYSIEYLVFAGTRTLQLNFSPLKRDRVIFGVSVFGKDITERKRADEELRQYRDHLEELVARRTAELQQEIDERKRAEMAMQESEERLRNILENVPIGMFQSTPAGKFIYTNPSLATMLGYASPEELIQTVNQTSIADTVYEDPAKRPLFVEQVERLHGDWKTFDNRYRRKDGRIIDGVLFFCERPDLRTGQRFLYGFIQDITDRKQAEDALRESEEKYRLLAENISDVIWVSAIPGGELKYISPSIFQQRGYTVAEAMAQKGIEQLTPESAEKVAKVMPPRLDEFLRTQTSQVFVERFQLPCKDGRIITIESASQFRFAKDGSVEIVGVSRDITQRLQIEAQLQAAEEQTRLILDAAGDGIFGVNREGRLYFINTSAEYMLGWTAAELLGQNVHDFIHHARADGSPYPLEECPMCSAYQDGMTAHVKNEILWRKDGTWFDVEYTARPIYKNGLRTGAVITFLDITERKRAEAALQASEARYRALVETSPDAITLVDRMGCIRFCNAQTARLLGYDYAEELIGQNAFQFVHPEDRGRAMERRTSADDASRMAIEYRIVTKAGETRTVETNSSLIRTAAGRAEILLSVLRDITARKQMEAEIIAAKDAAEAASRAKSAFLANMSHELRTPLNLIAGFAQIMARSQTLPPEHQEYVEAIHRSGDHLLFLINQVLDFSKIEADRMTVNETECDLAHVIDDIAALCALRAKEKGVRLLIERSPDAPRRIRTDTVKLRQILLNLLSNAVKFTPQGSVALRLFEERPALPPSADAQDGIKTTLHVEVEDTGIGIAPEDIAALFEPFRKAAAGKQTQEGAGLGLALSRQFAKLLGGDLTVQSQVGAGSLFRLTIQATVLDAERRQTPPASLPHLLDAAPFTLNASALAALPADLQAGLRDAVDQADVELAQAMIEKIRRLNASFADALAELVDKYRFDTLLTFFSSPK